MKRVALLLFLAGCLVPLASAQDHFQVGAYADYFRISQTKSNMAGLGARLGVKALPYVMLEGEMSYDFNQAFKIEKPRYNDIWAGVLVGFPNVTEMNRSKR